MDELGSDIPTKTTGEKNHSIACVKAMDGVIITADKHTRKTHYHKREGKRYV
jgi:hypothetical protein